MAGSERVCARARNSGQGHTIQTLRGATANTVDYSQAESWYKISDITKDVDAFFVYPTAYVGENDGDPHYASIDSPEMHAGVKLSRQIQASVFEDSCNLFIPYYRQASMRFEAEVATRNGDIREALAGPPCEDICAALDYYFEHYNEGRPFIFAGHSQGAAVVELVLEDYFREHPVYLERMVCAYAIGYSITKDYLDANPHLRFATGESDTGVIVSWNTEGPRNTEENATNMVVLPGAISINPLNWRRDDTYAPASLNLGSLVPNAEMTEFAFGDIDVDAQVNVERGVVVTNIDFPPMPQVEIFGPASYHIHDYLFFYNNIKDNVAKRIQAYLHG